MSVIVMLVVVASVAGACLWVRYARRGQAGGIGATPALNLPSSSPTFTSSVDANGNGVDDYTDIVRGARKDAEAMPTYDTGYYQGGYPPSDRGACTDVVWRAFANAGYDLKAMVDADITARPQAYSRVISKPDPNIDFRRTGVLDVFFSTYGVTLGTDIHGDDWEQGDIVVFEHTRHIGVISDRRDKQGMPLIIHNMGQKQRENDYLAFRTHMAVTGHYRFDASRVPQSVIKTWSGPLPR
ncbi:DUF1287 domain-containing protein [Bifidobacterium thermacidophilum]|uniref:DUF1287 domain-containing protein n=1 Tax=Bifidobacterium thermacidophilum TaxID=246618 RepID=A0ABW8KPQ4_9BIFI